MREFLLDYHPIHPTTWVYLSSLLMIGVFFKFSRLWSVRNLDLLLLATLAPGLLLVRFGNEASQNELADGSGALGVENVSAEQNESLASVVNDSAEGATTQIAPEELDAVNSMSADASGGSTNEPPAASEVVGPESAGLGARQVTDGQVIEFYGFVWLLSACGLMLFRMLLDPTMVRRPLLEPNLSSGGLTFIGCSLFVFLMANVVSSPTTADDLQGPKGARQLLTRAADEDDSDHLRRHGPGNAVLHLLPSLVTMPQQWGDAEDRQSGTELDVRTAKAMAILSHLAVVFGIVAIGYRHFDNIQMGIGAATLYLMLPYTAQMTGRVDHVLPAALLVWAVLCYRRPLLAGMFIGSAIGVVYYPLFLLPLWISFYWQRGLMRFLIGVSITLVLMVLSLILVSPDLAGFVANVQKMFGIWFPVMDRLHGIWGLGWDPIYRLPVLAAFIAVSGAMALWPAQKNLGTLLSCTAGVMVGTQFWHGYGGGLYLAWSLPLMLLTIFRPNLEDRVALTVLGEGWLPRRRHTNLAA